MADGKGVYFKKLTAEQVIILDGLFSQGRVAQSIDEATENSQGAML